MFAKRLAELRKAANLNQSELARRAGLTSQAVCQLENGKRRPLLETSRKLAAVLGVTVDELMSDPASNAA